MSSGPAKETSSTRQFAPSEKIALPPVSPFVLTIFDLAFRQKPPPHDPPRTTVSAGTVIVVVTL